MVQCPGKAKIESMEEYSEAKTQKSKPELRNSNRNAAYFYSSAKLFESVASHAVFVYNIKPWINPAWDKSSADICADNTRYNQITL